MAHRLGDGMRFRQGKAASDSDPGLYGPDGRWMFCRCFLTRRVEKWDCYKVGGVYGLDGARSHERTAQRGLIRSAPGLKGDGIVIRSNTGREASHPIWKRLVYAFPFLLILLTAAVACMVIH